jgi:K+-transporting ATPase KdpF subunit
MIATSAGDNIIGLVLAVLVTAYLVYALVFPEKL